MSEQPINPLMTTGNDPRAGRGVSTGAVGLSAFLLLGLAVFARSHFGDTAPGQVMFLVGGIASMLQGGGLLFSLLEHLAGRSIRRGEHLAHWMLPPGVRLDGGEDGDGERKAELPVAGAVVFVVPFVLLFSLSAVPAGVAWQVLSVVVLLLPAVALPLLLDRIAQRIRGTAITRPERAEVLITFSGVLIGGEWHRWGDPNALATGSFDPRRLRLSVSYRPPSEPRSVRTVNIPVPPGLEAEARRVLAALGLSSRAPAAAAIRSCLRPGPDELHPHSIKPRHRRSVLQRRRDPVLLGLSGSAALVVLGLIAFEPITRWTLIGLAVASLVLSVGGLLRLWERVRTSAWQRLARSIDPARAAVSVIPMTDGEAVGVRIAPVRPVGPIGEDVRAATRLLDGGDRTGDPAFDAVAGVVGPRLHRVAVFDAGFRAAFVEVARHHDLSVGGGELRLIPGGWREWWPPSRRALLDAIIALSDRLVVDEDEVLPRVIAAAEDDACPAAAIDALVALEEIDPDRAAEIAARLEAHEDPRVRLMVAELRGRDGLSAIEPLLEHHDADVRLRAARDLVALLPPMVAAERTAEWVSDPDVRLRHEALWTAAKRGLPAFAVPEEVLRGLPVDIALDVIGWVAKLPPEDGQPVLIGLFNHPERLVGISALHAIGAIGTPSALAAIHRSRVNPELSAAALRAVDLIKARYSRRVGGGGLSMTSGEFGGLGLPGRASGGGLSPATAEE